jgi:hypothetical protein
MYAISDIPYKDGEWYVYYRIPNESGVWTSPKAFGGGWSEKTAYEQSGMEIAQNRAPQYEGATEVAWTNQSIQPGSAWEPWTGAEYLEPPGPGNTCIAPLTAAGYASPGNAADAGYCP